MISQGPSVCVFNKSDNGEVMASWLFAQYLLTNDVQIAYSQTEGYAPVTSKAQNSEIYKDYLSREGEDNELYYDVKLKATKLLIHNTEKTFVTPVFNGSASLRNAAGQMVENVTKSMRRHETVDEAYFEELYSSISSLYRLDQRDMATEKADLGELPLMSKTLIGVLGGTWVLIGFYVASEKIKKRKK
jgi:multiple sugar transport system substrate-binding protein